MRNSKPQQQEHIPVPIGGIKHVTDKAVLVDYFDIDLGKFRGVWIPKSQLGDPDDIEPDPEAQEIYVTPWFCKKEGME